MNDNDTPTEKIDLIGQFSLTVRTGTEVDTGRPCVVVVVFPDGGSAFALPLPPDAAEGIARKMLACADRVMHEIQAKPNAETSPSVH